MGESTNMSRLVFTRQPHLVILPIDRDMLHMLLRELLNRSLDRLHAALLAHLLRGEVGVAAGTVPVAGEGLGVEGDLDAEHLRDADEEVARHPEVVAHGDALARADLEFPLGGHDLGVDSGDVDTGIETCTVMRFDDIAGEDLASTWGGNAL